MLENNKLAYITILYIKNQEWEDYHAQIYLISVVINFRKIISLIILKLFAFIWNRIIIDNEASARELIVWFL